MRLLTHSNCKFRIVLSGTGRIYIMVTKFKNPQKIIKTLATSGPATKWKLKERTQLDYSRIHEVIKRLESGGFVKVLKTTRSEKGLTIKVYSLTFQGIVSYLDSYSLTEPSHVGKLNESTETFKERYFNEKNSYLKDLNELMNIVEKWGLISTHPIFAEIQWFLKYYPKEIIGSIILDLAKFVYSSLPHTSYSNFISQLRKEKAKLKREQKLIKELPKSLQKIQITSWFGDKSAPKSTDEIDFLKKVNFQIKQTDINLERMLEDRNNFLQNNFAELFFERIHVIQTKEKNPNKTLHNLAKDLYEKKMSGVSPLEWAINMFGVQHED